MKIAVLMGSPRKKDSYSICKEIESVMRGNHDHIEFDYIFINDHNIQDCKGCTLCFKKGEDQCPFKADDLSVIKKRLSSADGLIIASPVYAYQVTAQLKRVIDRLSYLFHRPEMGGIPTLIVVTTDGGGSKQVYKYLKLMVSGWGLALVGNLQICAPWYFKERFKTSVFEYNNTYFQKKQKEIKRLSLTYRERIAGEVQRKPSFYDIFIFNCLRSKIYTSKLDREYWIEKHWVDSDYFYDVSLNPIKKVFGKFIKKIVHMMCKRYVN